MSNITTIALDKYSNAVRTIASSSDVSQRLQGLGEDAYKLLEELTLVVNLNPTIMECKPASVYNAVLGAHTLGLSLNPQLGEADIIPYGKDATFQIGWKGYFQLAIDSGKYESINVTPVYEDEIESYDKISGALTLKSNFNSKGKKKVGVVAHYKLLNGFQKYLYMSIEELEEHAKKYSMAYRKNAGAWANPDMKDAMYMKTVLKALIRKFGVKSSKMTKAITLDQAAIDNTGTPHYVDNAQPSASPNANNLDTANFTLLSVEVSKDSPSVHLLTCKDTLGTTISFPVAADKVGQLEKIIGRSAMITYDKNTYQIKKFELYSEVAYPSKTQ